MKTHAVPALRLVGVRCRTTPAEAVHAIGELWARAGEAVLRTDEPAFSAYFAYEPDGAYSVLVGRALAPDASPPAGLEVLDVPGQPCVVEEVTAEPAAVGAWWGALWQRWPDGGPRTFTVDVERWSPGGSVEIFVGVDPSKLED